MLLLLNHHTAAHLSGIARIRWLNSLRALMVRPLAGWCAASRISWSQKELISAERREGRKSGSRVKEGGKKEWGQVRRLTKPQYARKWRHSQQLVKPSIPAGQAATHQTSSGPCSSWRRW